MRRFWSLNIFEIFVATALTLSALTIVAVRLTNAVEPHAISVKDAWARPTIGGSTTGAAYLKIRNSGATDDKLIGLRTPVSEKAELHHTQNDAGVMRMRHVSGGVGIPANGVFLLEPGGRHVMLIRIKAPLKKGQTFPLTLIFEKAGEIGTTVAVNIMPPSHASQRGSHR